MGIEVAPQEVWLIIFNLHLFTHFHFLAQEGREN